MSVDFLNEKLLYQNYLPILPVPGWTVSDSRLESFRFQLLDLLKSKDMRLPLSYPCKKLKKGEQKRLSSRSITSNFGTATYDVAKYL